jgi:outer membrane protein assembly factor BamB
MWWRRVCTKGFAFSMRTLKSSNMKSALLALSLVLGVSSGFSANWPQFRGPEFNGSTPEKNLPAQWSKTEKVAWAVDLPGMGAATPVIWDDHVFVSSTDKRTKSTVALALDRKSGQVLWQHTVGAGDARDERSNYAAPSPATDGKLVVFFYGNGELVAFDFSGKKLWQRNLQKDHGDFAFQWTFSTSPLLFEGKLYLQVLQRDVPVNGRGAKPSGIESYLLAIDPQTGKDQWKHVRPADAAAESLEAFTTPVPYVFNGRKELLIAGGDCLTGHDPVTGKELWRSGSWNPTRIPHWRLVPSPVAGAGVILGCAPKKSPVYAVKAGGKGNQPWLWTSEVREVSSDVPTPLFYEGDFIVLSDVTSSISRVEPQTGKVKWTVATPGRSKHEASPTGADGKIYIMNFLGDVTVINAADGKILATIPMGEPGDNNTRSVIAVSQGQLFIRTNTKLYCIDGAAKKLALNRSAE